ncbi:hypothetical protein [uncultured Roseovarius sp.]|uniref:cupin domain-containing protein n=1 Tax=uncultured Roseovarius sp. TaxID=293344 RepID=UPI002606A3DA|nr:hypothetical protein [uncultured Roseovarius sp.]
MTLKIKFLIFAVFTAGIVVGLMSSATIIPRAQAKALVDCRQHYPNIPGRVLLEDDKMVVQRFTFPPGQWEGVHAHPPHQLYIMLTGTNWTVRYGDNVSSGYSPAGSVGFYGPVDLSEDHESVNSGDIPADLIWVTLKDGCLS